MHLTLADVIAAILHQKWLLRDLWTALELNVDSRTCNVEDCLVINIVTTVPESVQRSSRAAFTPKLPYAQFKCQHHWNSAIQSAAVLWSSTIISTWISQNAGHNLAWPHTCKHKVLPESLEEQRCNEEIYQDKHGYFCHDFWYLFSKDLDLWQYLTQAGGRENVSTVENKFSYSDFDDCP